MKNSFKCAYEAVCELKDDLEKNVGILFSSHFGRIKQLTDFFEKHSGYSVKKLDLSEFEEAVSEESDVTASDIKEKIFDLAEDKPEYLIIEDSKGVSINFVVLEDICDIIDEIAETIPVVIASPHGSDVSVVYGYGTTLIDIPSPNERSLKIKPSSLETERLYLRNQTQAIHTGVFLANNDFFNNFIKNKMDGDSLLASGKYDKAFEKYSEAISFHCKYDNTECSVNDFLSLTMYIRCVACFVYGKWSERNDTFELMKERAVSVLSDLKVSSMAFVHKNMICEYGTVFDGLQKGRLTETNFLLFLNEYVI